MPDPSTYRPAPGHDPRPPGVYRFRDATGRVIYVGKAKSLRSRLNSYFADTWTLHARTQQMVTTAASVDWVTVGTEVEALQLEYTWIKEYDPRFNVRYRDDKSLPVPRGDPGRGVSRGCRSCGARSARACATSGRTRTPGRSARRSTCCCGSSRRAPARPGVFKRAGQIGRPCLLGYIGKCSAPCVGHGLRRRAPARSSTTSATSWPAAPTRMVKRLEREMMQACERAGVRAGGPAARRPRPPCAGPWRSRRWCSATAPTPTWSPSPTTRSRRPCRSSTSAAAGYAASAAGWWRRPRTSPPATWCTTSAPRSTAASRARRDVPRELLVPELPADADALADWLTGPPAAAG